MIVNTKNEKIYHDAFVSDGKYGDIKGWKPSIDEREIEDSREDEEGHYVPATPLGYRDYKISRLDGIKNILAGEANLELNFDEIHNIVREDNTLRQYDKLIMLEDKEGGIMQRRWLVVVGDDEDKFYLVDADNHMYYIKYKKPSLILKQVGDVFKFSRNEYTVVATFEDEGEHFFVAKYKKKYGSVSYGHVFAYDDEGRIYERV